MYGPTTLHGSAPRSHGRPGRRLLVAAMALLAVLGWLGRDWYQGSAQRAVDPDRAFDSTDSRWPHGGQAAFELAAGQGIQVSGEQNPVPIASVAKVMTAYLVLRDLPLHEGESGPSIPVSDADVAATGQRRNHGESVIALRAGVTLTELQALQALLIPSANNVAALLASWDAGSEQAFIARMNRAANALGMGHTRYTDPSGFDPQTVSTAADQVRLIEAAMADPVFAGIVATASVRLPVAGTVHNTDALLGQHGVIGGKTGSDDAAGGCFAFQAVRSVRGHRYLITGVVLGQRDGPPVPAALGAAAGLVDRVVAGLAGPG